MKILELSPKSTRILAEEHIDLFGEDHKILVVYKNQELKRIP